MRPPRMDESSVRSTHFSSSFRRRFFSLARVVVRTDCCLVRASMFRTGTIYCCNQALGVIFRRSRRLRGHALGRLSANDLFEVFHLSRCGRALSTCMVGPLSPFAMGVHRRRWCVGLQGFALMRQSTFLHPVNLPVQIRGWNFMLRFRSSPTVAFALAVLAVESLSRAERHLNRDHLQFDFYHLPPLPDLFAAITRLTGGFLALQRFWDCDRFFYVPTIAARTGWWPPVLILNL